MKYKHPDRTQTRLMSPEEEQIMRKAGTLHHMCVSVGKAQVTRCDCHPAQCSAIFHAGPYLHSWPHCLNNTYRLRLAGHSSSITATIHRQNNRPPAPVVINQHTPHGRTNRCTHAHKSVHACYYVCACVLSFMCLSSAINILQLIM